jgi:hypothetical protein
MEKYFSSLKLRLERYGASTMTYSQHDGLGENQATEI